MTVNSAYNPIQYPGAGVIAPLPIGWTYGESSDVVVTQIDNATLSEVVRVLGTHYTLTKTDNGGFVTPLAAIAVGKSWRISRNTPILQPDSLRLGGSFSEEAVEEMFNRQTRISQEMDAKIVSGDTLLRGELASDLPSKGSALLAYPDPVAPAFLKTMSDIVAGERVSALRAIDKTKWAAIRAGTSTDDVRAGIVDMLADMGSLGYGQVYFPAGQYTSATGSITIPANVHVTGDGRLATKLRFTAVGQNGLVFSAGSATTGITVDGTNVAGSCFLMAGATGARIHDCRAKSAQSHGFAITVGANGCMLSSVYAETCGSRGILIERGTDTDPPAYNNIVHGAHISGCTNAALLLGHGVTGNVISDVIATGTANAAIWVHNAASKNTLSGIMVRSSAAAAGTPGLLVASGSVDNVFSNIFVESYEIGVLLRGGPVDPNLTASDTKRNIFDNVRLIGTGSGVSGSAAIKIDSVDSGTTKVTDNWLRGVVASSYQNGLYDPVGNAALDNFISDSDFSNSITTPFSLSLTGSRTRLRDVRGYTPAGFIASPPAVAATGVAVTNSYPYPVMVYVNGMPAGGNVQINGAGIDPTAAPNNGNGGHLLRPQQTIALIYSSGTPTWRWFGVD